MPIRCAMATVLSYLFGCLSRILSDWGVILYKSLRSLTHTDGGLASTRPPFSSLPTCSFLKEIDDADAIKITT